MATNKNAFHRFCKEAAELSRGHLVQGSGETTHTLNMGHSYKRAHSPVSYGKVTLEKKERKKKSKNQVSGQPQDVKFAKCFFKHNLSPNCD